ncbi:MAG TPA: HYExAFE family protein [Pirellulales bacterium]|jgi:hypothetical protein|nr:HYExAFE family protein [Pirellulales bacterium]
MKRDNHYEKAFEEFLRARRVPYVAVDETRRSLLGDESLKSLDFIVNSSCGIRWLVDVKGRRFPSGLRRQYWKNWSTRDDLVSLGRWERMFGELFRGLFVFAYNVQGRVAPLPAEQLFTHAGRTYGFVAIPAAQYARHARQLSPRWDTVMMPVRTFRELATPMERVL